MNKKKNHTELALYLEQVIDNRIEMGRTNLEIAKLIVKLLDKGGLLRKERKLSKKERKKQDLEKLKHAIIYLNEPMLARIVEAAQDRSQNWEKGTIVMSPDSASGIVALIDAAKKVVENEDTP